LGEAAYSAHGLRKASLRRLAHAGASGVEMMAVSGHSSLDQLQEYLEVDQDMAAEAAMAKLTEIKPKTKVNKTWGMAAQSRALPAVKKPPGPLAGTLENRRLKTEDISIG
jgi:hypothetical protein